MKTPKKVSYVGGSPMVSMGPIRLKQPLPNHGVRQVDPFLLLHHYGPYDINPESNPFDLGPHPHRGFEPITLLYKGEQRHRDSLGNESIVKAGDVQWTTAGRGVIHSEGPTKAFVEKGGALEGIQLWLNLPKSKKMMPANYQHVKAEEMPVVTNEDGSIILKVVAGNQKGHEGLIVTQTPVNVFMLEAEVGGELEIDIPENHKASVYLLDGEVEINDEVNLVQGKKQFVAFEAGGEGIKLVSKVPSRVLILSGEPFDEPVAQYGPYVMNTQTELMEAMRDFQQGKMGYLEY